MLTSREQYKAALRPLVGDVAWILLRRARRAVSQRLGHHPVIYSVAPHDLSRYHDLLDRLLREGRTELLLEHAHLAHQHRADRVNLVLRHDVDFDPRRLFAMTELEVRSGVRSTVYVRTDGEAYRVQDFQDPLRELARQGFEIGLHSSAFREDSPGWAFLEEVRIFRESLGFAPAVMTTHGFHPFTLKVAVRQERFLRELSRHRVAGILSNEFPGYGFDLTITDSNFSPGRIYTYLTEEFPRLPSYPVGRRVQLLTHPEYWGGAQPDGVAMRTGRREGA